ncbi:hypothetical protein AAVH_22582 [Aphelenchoides avenae]|nr:hypothetical protein AAVH_22582 [Aphelenchus avenae]
MPEPGQAENNDEPQLPNEENALNAAAPDFERIFATVEFKTSTGRILVAENQSASMTYGDFRKLFGVPANGSKRIIFKKTADNVSSMDKWVVAVDDCMQLPFVDGCIVAETCVVF